jgi:alpha-galactosidase
VNYTLTGATTEYTVAVVGDRIDLVAWGPHGVSDGPSPYGFHGKVQYMLPGDVAAVEYAPSGVRPFHGADVAVAGTVLTWRLDSVSSSDGLTAVFVDDVTGLRASVRWRFVPGTDVISRWVVVHNGGSDPVVVTRLDSAGFSVPTPSGATLAYLYGQWAQEFTPGSVSLVRGRFQIGSTQGVSGHDFSPYLALDNGDAAYGVGLAWSGSWHITADAGAVTRVRAGRSLSGAPITLGPGESVTTPPALGVYSADGLDGVARQWHAYERHLAGDRLGRTRKVIYNSWEATAFDVTAAGQLELADIAASLGVETFVVDDGWFAGRHDDAGGLGDWTPDPAKFPDGFGAFVDAVRSRGLEFGLWVEPEMVNPASALYAAHPDWIYQTDGRPRTLIRNQYLLNLGRSDVFEFVRDTLDSLLRSYPISYLKWDFNRPRTEAAAAPDVDGAHVRNLYRILDHLRTEHPSVTVEGCAAGGARVDYGMAARTDVVWPSDNTAPLDRLRIQHGFLSAHAPHLMSSWVTDAPGMFAASPRSLAFRFVLASAGVLGIGADIRSWTASQRSEAASWVARYKKVRDVITTGTVHRIGSPSSDRCAVQYTLGDRVVVLAWNATGALDGVDQVPARDIRLPLRGLDPASRYRLGSALFSGSHLMAAGLPVRWTPSYDADLIELERIEA